MLKLTQKYVKMITDGKILYILFLHINLLCAGVHKL